MAYNGPGVDKRLMPYAVKNLMLKADPCRRGGVESLQEFYRDVCNLRLPSGAGPVKICLPQPSQQYVAPAHTAFRDLAPLGDGRFLAIEEYGRRIVAISGADGMQDLPVEYGAFALTGTSDGFAFIAAEGRQLTVLNRDLTIQSSRSLEAFGISVGIATRLTTVEGRYAVVAPESRQVVFLDAALRLRNSVDLPHGSIVHDAVGYNGGVLLSENVPLCNDSGALLWVSEQGDVVSIFDGLARPWGVSVFEECILVGDFRVLHFVHADGLAVVGHQCIPWDAFAQRIQARSGFIREAVVHGNSVTTVVRLLSGGTYANTNVCLYEFALNDIF